jgi:Na+/H+ antiporter NhaD/arsenite permease-like protein
MILPFVLLLAAIALAPLICPKWWNKHYPKVAGILGAITLAYYLLGLEAYSTVLHVAHEYVSFIALIGSLYIVSGGIHIAVKGEATPLVNVAFLFVGGLSANILGTTGASMLLIRPWLRMNKYRITAHHVVFFIFIVSNVGGCLTPIGDPPLFLGYLNGVPFWWVATHCWLIWLTGLAILLVMFYVVDLRNYRRAPEQIRATLAEPHDRWRFEGVSNLFFLGLILGAVFLDQPDFLREALMLVAAVGSYLTTRKSIHAANHFNFHPIQEVAILFVGIFATMLPALDWLELNAAKMGNPSPGLFYWGSGVLSSVLDNAPTYLSFLHAIFGAFLNTETINQVQHLIQTGGLDLATASEPVRNTYEALRHYHSGALAAQAVSQENIEVAYLLGNNTLNAYLVAVSIGAVFFGANTYIGNGPNFMVKSIADHAKVHMPGFLGYVFKFTVPYMIPMLVMVWWLFFRR